MYKIGEVTIDVVRDGVYRTDGGAAFGIIPRTIWAQAAPPDELGRIPMAVNCFLIRTKRWNVLVDTGLGNKLPDKMRGLHDAPQDGALMVELAALGCPPDKIHAVVLTHLHWDHAGGATQRDENSGLRVSFPNATYYVQNRDWDEAINANARTRGGFRLEDLLPLKDPPRIRFLEGDSFLNKNVSVIVTGGHTTAHQIVRVASRGEVGYIAGDVIPQSLFLHPAYATAYDLFPLTTLEAKQSLLRRAHKRGATLFLSHELSHPAGKVGLDEKGHFAFEPVSSLEKTAKLL